MSLPFSAELRGLMRIRSNAHEKLVRVQKILSKNPSPERAKLTVLAQVLPSYYTEHNQCYEKILMHLVDNRKELDALENAYRTFETLYYDVGQDVNERLFNANAIEQAESVSSVVVIDKAIKEAPTIEGERMCQCKSRGGGTVVDKETQEPAKQMPESQVPVKQETERHVPEKQQPVNQESEKQELEKQESEKLEPDNSVEEVKRRAIGVIRYLLYNWGDKNVLNKLLAKEDSDHLDYSMERSNEVLNSLTTSKLNVLLTLTHCNQLDSLTMDRLGEKGSKNFHAKYVDMLNDLTRHVVSLIILEKKLSKSKEKKLIHRIGALLSPSFLEAWLDSVRSGGNDRTIRHLIGFLECMYEYDIKRDIELKYNFRALPELIGNNPSPRITIPVMKMNKKVYYYYDD